MTTETFETPGSARTARSAAALTGSIRAPSSEGTSSTKLMLPASTASALTIPVETISLPSGRAMRPSSSTTCSFDTSKSAPVPIRGARCRLELFRRDDATSTTTSAQAESVFDTGTRGQAHLRETHSGIAQLSIAACPPRHDIPQVMMKPAAWRQQ